MASFDIKSPKATRVKAVAVRSGQQVAEGAVLFELFDFEELTLLAMADRAIEDNAAKLDEVRGHRPRRKLELLKLIVAQRVTSSKAAEAKVASVIEERNVGQRTTLDVLTAQSEASAKLYHIIQAAAEADIYEKNISDTIEVLTQVAEILHRDREYVDEFRKRLVIRSPADGFVDTDVEVGAPVKRGSVLGRLRT